MSLVLGVVSDIHLGPLAHFEGKLRKLSHEAPRLLEEAVAGLRALSPDLVVNLGDDLEDESYGLDLARYEECQRILRSVGVPIVNVAGNHDTVHLKAKDLLRVWGEDRAHLHGSRDVGGHHLIVLHTVERKDVDVRVHPDQLAWLREDLAATSLPTIVLMHHPAGEQDLSDTRWFHAAPHIALVAERRALREILEQSGKVRLVLNGHVHRNHFEVIRGIGYVTFQSLVENLDDDAPGRPARSYGLVRVAEGGATIRVLGDDRAAYAVHW